MTIKDQAAIVGVGATPYYKRGQSFPETELSMACTAILGALEDAGLSVDDLDGFAIYSNSCDPAEVASVLGVPEVRFAASLTSGGGGCAGALGLAAAAIHGGMATCCVTLMTLQQLNKRLGGSEVGGVLAYATMSDGGSSPYGGGGIGPNVAFTANSGLLSPGHSFSVLTQRHMYQYGTKREHFAEVAIDMRPTTQGIFPAVMTETYANETSQAFWDAAKQDKLVAPKCTECGTFRLPPSPFCFNCRSRTVEWTALPGTGTVYSFTIVRHALSPGLAAAVPYAAGVVELDGTQGAGARMIVNIIDCDVDRLKIGDNVEVVFEHISDSVTEMAVPRFRPVRS